MGNVYLVINTATNLYALYDLGASGWGGSQNGIGAPDAVVRAIAALDNLSIKSPDAMTLRIGAPRHATIRNLSELRSGILNRLPDSVVRYLRLREIGQWNIAPTKLSQLAGFHDLSKDSPEEKKQSEILWRSGQLNNQIHAAFFTEFQAVKEKIDRRAAKGEPASLPFDALSTEAQGMFALYWLNHLFLSRLQTFPENPPDFITKFDNAILTGGWKWSPKDKDNVFTARIAIHHPDGTITGVNVATSRSTRFPE